MQFFSGFQNYCCTVGNLILQSPSTCRGCGFKGECAPPAEPWIIQRAPIEPVPEKWKCVAIPPYLDSEVDSAIVQRVFRRTQLNDGKIFLYSFLFSGNFRKINHF